jgi:hypothetical protein
MMLKEINHYLISYEDSAFCNSVSHIYSHNKVTNIIFCVSLELGA